MDKLTKENRISRSLIALLLCICCVFSIGFSTAKYEKEISIDDLSLEVVAKTVVTLNYMDNVTSNEEYIYEGSLPIPTRTGYTFAGWYVGVYDNGNWTYGDILSGDPKNGSTLLAKWTLTTYTISYTLDGGTVATANPSSYNMYSAAITLNNPTKKDYVFAGWTGSNGSTPQKTVTIATGSTGNKNYTANWIAKVSQAIYTESDGSLTFIYDKPYKAGETYNGKSVAAVYTGFESKAYDETTVPWYSNRSNIKSVVFKDEMKPTSTANWFRGMSTCTSMDLAKLNTESVTDMSYMFRDCKALTSLEISHFNTSKVQNMRYLFRDCSGLTNLNVSGWNTSNVTNMYSVFQGCTNLTTVDVSKWNTGKVTTMEVMFANCSNLTTLDVSNFNTTNVTNLHSTFQNCSKLSTLNVSNWKTDKVTTMSNLFASCSSLTTVDVSKWNTAKVTSMANMFYNCSNLTTLDVSNFDTSNVQSINGMFRLCKKLTALDVSGWNTGNITDMTRAFYACYQITSLNVSDWNTANVTTFQDMFLDCTGLLALDVSKWNTGNAINMRGMFYTCNKITSLDVSNWNTENVETMRNLFYECLLLSNPDVSNWKTAKVTDMANMFYNCRSLTTLDLSSFNTSNVTATDGMFNQCRALTTIYVSDSWSMEKVSESSSMFSDVPLLVGGMGTAFSSSHTDAAYAKIDGGTSDPGYLTEKTAAVDPDTTTAPNYVVQEANRVAQAIQAKKSTNSLTFLAGSDMHNMADGEGDASVVAQIRESNKHAGQAMQLISESISLDFITNLGDLAWGSSSTTIEQGRASIIEAVSFLPSETIIVPGNHDPLTYSYPQNGEYLDDSILASLIGNYRYIDYVDKKVRVIYLNTSETTGVSVSYSTGIEHMSAAQLQWFAQSLDLSEKTDAKEWGILIMSHHPLDWGSIMPAANLLQAYLTGSNYSTTHEGSAVSYDFNGKNAAAVIAQFHGHVHCNKLDYIYYRDNGVTKPTTVLRIAIPNMCYYRNNEYGTNGKTEYYGIEFGETDATYSKTANSAQDTAFCGVTIDLDNHNIYVIYYGVGYDRVVSYIGGDVVSYTITNNLTGAVNSNGESIIIEGSSYSADISPLLGYELKTITVTMGGADITASAVNGNNISIDEVTGDIVITVTTSLTDDFNYGEFTNLVLYAEEADSTDIYYDVGYKNNTYVSSDGKGTDVTSTGVVSTGYIPYAYSSNNVIYIKGATLDTTSSYTRIFTYNSKDYQNTSVGYAQGARINDYYTVETLGDRYYKLTPTGTQSLVQYLRISLLGTGENLIVTVNEQIHAEETISKYTITNILNNVTNSNPASSVEGGSAYNATLTANPGYTLSSVTVKLGDVDVTNTAYSNGSISISNVTGNIVITATAEATDPVGYTNLVPTAVADNTGAIFNSPYGYKDGYYISSSTENKFSVDANCVATGSILLGTDVEAIYVKGATWDTTNSHVRFYAGAAVGGLGYTAQADGTGSHPIGTLVTLEVLGDDYYKFTLTEQGKTYLSGKYYRFSLVGTGADLIITHDQPISNEEELTNYTVTNNLTNVVTNNNVSYAVESSSYSATLTADTGYVLSNVAITMGGTDITASAYSNGVITISKVTGAIVITATAEAVEEGEGSYTNLVPTSLDYDLDGVFNSTGYKNGYYVTTTSPYYNVDSSNVGCTVMGLIPYDTTVNSGYSTPPTIYIKGVTFDTSNSRNRIGLYQTAASKIYATWNVANTASFSKYFTIETLGTQYYKITPVVDANGKNAIYATYGDRITYIGISATGDGANMIVTLDEPIETSAISLSLRNEESIPDEVIVGESQTIAAMPDVATLNAQAEEKAFEDTVHWCWLVDSGMAQQVVDPDSLEKTLASVYEIEPAWDMTLTPLYLREDLGLKLLACAEQELGTTESISDYIWDEFGDYKGYTKYGEMYGIPYGDWCAMFIGWCMDQVGIEDLPCHPGCETWLRQVKEEDLYRATDKYVPGPGDVVFISYSEDKSADHVGIVKSVDLEEGILRLVEGNYSNAVMEVERPIDAQILGYMIVSEYGIEKEVSVSDEYGDSVAINSTTIVAAPVAPPEETETTEPETEVTVPDTTVPEIEETVPNNTTPPIEETVPENTVPPATEEKAPETTVPPVIEDKAPETTVPPATETVPEATVPEVTTPETSKPSEEETEPAASTQATEATTAPTETTEATEATSAPTEPATTETANSAGSKSQEGSLETTDTAEEEQISSSAGQDPAMKPEDPAQIEEPAETNEPAATTTPITSEEQQTASDTEAAAK